MSQSIKNAVDELCKVTIQTKALFGNLSSLQLNWKPTPEKWSIAQCLDHLIVSNSTYYPQLNEVISGQHRNSSYQNLKIISRFSGNYLIKQTGAIVSKPMKSPSAFIPSKSEISAAIVVDFEKHQNEFTSRLRKLDAIDLDNTVISSPALKIITYSLNDLLKILVGHEQRHLKQAKNILEHPKFPK